MWIRTAVVLVGMVTCVLGYCRNSIKVKDVSSSYGNQIVNGEYVKLYDHGDSASCDSRDVFNHTTQNIYLYHVGDLTGYWLFRDSYDCISTAADDANVRSKDGELNPGLVQTGWEENTGGGGWNRDSAIDVDCFEIPKCRYQLTGAYNTTLNGYYDEFGDSECEFRDVHKHETQEAYLYFIWSEAYNEYYWVINKAICVDSVNSGAYLFNDDYSVSPELILDDWAELNNNSQYIVNPNADIDCFGGATKPGIYTSMVLAFVVFWSAL